MQQYMRRQLGELPPHIYAIANEVYESMWKKRENQCVLIRLGPPGRGRGGGAELVAFWGLGASNLYNACWVCVFLALGLGVFNP